MTEEKYTKLINDVMKKCAAFVGVSEGVTFYTYNHFKRKMVIYTDKPGYWIGPYGKNIPVIKEAIAAYLDYNEGKEVQVDFVELNAPVIGQVHLKLNTQ